MIPENVYGHRKRLTWIRGHLSRDQSIIEIGCGTGHMITRPLLEAGYQVTGVDVDRASIAFGRQLFQKSGLDPSRLVCGTFQDLTETPGAVILSEVLEHLPDNEIRSLLDTVYRRLRPGGVLLVTVPNGYGWFEMENLLWNRTGLGRCLERTHVLAWVGTVKRRLFGPGALDYTPSSLNPAGHVQRFTARTAGITLQRSGFRVLERTGSTMAAGPLSELLFGGVTSVLKANANLGERFPNLASAFYLAARRAEP